MGTDLNPEEMKAFVRQHFEDFVNNKRAEVIRENMAPDFLDHSGPGDREVGVAEDEQMMMGMYERMPGLTVMIGDVVAQGDKVVCRNVWRWKDEGGMPWSSVDLSSGGSSETRSPSVGRP